MRTRTSTLPPPAHHRQLLRWMLGCLSMLAAIAFTHPAQAANAGGAADQPVVQQLLDAMSRNDYQGFVSQGTPEFGALSEQQFAEVANALSPRLKQGYTVRHLGNLRQQGLDISVWKVSFSDQGDELLATLNVRQGKVGGFFLR